jgi:hypothetical protein
MFAPEFQEKLSMSMAMNESRYKQHRHACECVHLHIDPRTSAWRSTPTCGAPDAARTSPASAETSTALNFCRIDS